MKAPIQYRGFSNIATLTAIGFLFIVTTVSFYRAALLNQETARVVSAQLDVSQREDLVVRSVLRSMADGMVPPSGGEPSTWTAIMAGADQNVKATTEVSMADRNVLFGTEGPTIRSGNLAADATSFTSIIQGDAGSTTPFAGSAAVSSFPSSPNYPPLLDWGSAAVSTSEAESSPTSFLYGAVYGSALDSASKSASGRWGLLTYPQIRFGFKNPGDKFIARRLWWRLPVRYASASSSADTILGVRFPPRTRDYLISLYEIPTQLPISGAAALSIGETSGESWRGGNIDITGNIYAEQLKLLGGTDYSGNLAAKTKIDVASGGTVAGQTVNNNFDALGERERRDAQNGPNSHPVSLSSNSGRLLFTSIDNGTQFFTASGSAPTYVTASKWNRYTQAFYKCRVRVLVRSDYERNLTPIDYSASDRSGPAVRKIYVDVQTCDDYVAPDSPLGVNYGDGNWVTHTYAQGFQDDVNTFADQDFMEFTSTNTGSDDRNLLIVNIEKLIGMFGSPASLYSVYIGSDPAVPPSNTAPGDLAVSVTGVHDLSTFYSGLSIVTKHRLYFKEDFNQTPMWPQPSYMRPPYMADITYPVPAADLPNRCAATSVFSPDIRYSLTSTAVSVNFEGSVAVHGNATTGSVDPLDFRSGGNGNIASSNKSLALTDIKNPHMVPPITRLNWLLVVDENRP